MTALIIGAVLGYLTCSSACAGVLLSGTEQPDEEDVFLAGLFGLLWPLMVVAGGLGAVGIYTRRKLIARRQRKVLPEARVR